MHKWQYPSSQTTKVGYVGCIYTNVFDRLRDLHRIVGAYAHRFDWTALPETLAVGFELLKSVFLQRRHTVSELTLYGIFRFKAVEKSFCKYLA